jgi:hypothetical protein
MRCEQSHYVWHITTLAGFTFALLMVIHSNLDIFFSHWRRERDGMALAHPFEAEMTEWYAFALHTLAYHIACFATTVFLLICAAIILALATMCLELVAIALSSVQRLFLRQRQDMALRQAEMDTEIVAGSRIDDYCDAWNYR